MAADPDDAPTPIALTPEQDAIYEQLFVGSCRAQEPTGEALLLALADLGDDVVVSPTKTYVGFATPRRQFGLFFPASGSRMTLRLRLDGTVRPHGRIQLIAPDAPRVRHDVVLYLAGPDEVDDEVRDLLRRAHDLSR